MIVNMLKKWLLRLGGVLVAGLVFFLVVFGLEGFKLFALECRDKLVVDVFICRYQQGTGCVKDLVKQQTRSCLQPDSSTCITTQSFCSSSSTCAQINNSCVCNASKQSCWVIDDGGGGAYCPVGFHKVCSDECKQASNCSGTQDGDCDGLDNNGVQKKECRVCRCVTNDCPATKATNLAERELGEERAYLDSGERRRHAKILFG